MAAIINDFPMVTDTLKKMIAYNPPSYSVFYEEHGVRKNLTAESVSESSNSSTTVLSVEDPEGLWHPEKYNLIVSGDIRLTPSLLFGKNGISGQNDELGLAVIWTAKEANVRGAGLIGSFNKTADTLSFQTEIKFKPDMIRGIVTLRTVLYLKSVGTRKHDERYFASAPGTILGTMDETRLIIDGNGSVFPVVQISKPDGPLWWTECNWTDASEDLFEEDNFCLYLNTAHPDYLSLTGNGNVVQSPLLNEIIASAVQILVTEVMSEADTAQNIRDGKNIAEGSVAAVVKYMIDVFGWDVNNSTPETLAADIRTSLDRKLKA